MCSHGESWEIRALRAVAARGGQLVQMRMSADRGEGRSEGRRGIERGRGSKKKGIGGTHNKQSCEAPVIGLFFRLSEIGPIVSAEYSIARWFILGSDLISG